MKIKKKCLQCNKEFELFLSRKDRKLCSKKCYFEFQKGKKKNRKVEVIEFRCLLCGKKKKVLKSQYFRKNIKKHFCSAHCRVEWITKNSRKVKVKCISCQNDFFVLPCRLKKTAVKFCSMKCTKEYNRGTNHYLFSGFDGIKSLRKCFKYRAWIIEILKRDNYKCQKCGSSDNLEVHHIKPLALILKENNITTLVQAFFCDELWDVNNGKTYCKKCHHGKGFHKRVK